MQNARESGCTFRDSGQREISLSSVLPYVWYGRAIIECLSQSFVISSDLTGNRIIWLSGPSLSLRQAHAFNIWLVKNPIEMSFVAPIANFSKGARVNAAGFQSYPIGEQITSFGPRYLHWFTVAGLGLG